ncbi:MAG: M20/M25/M40 family metallo-hydrolase [Planctomycetes bacterium]|nr:M20/M25/M40 family metallo-hydrolase [Planctomycetota bacterium]
MTSIITRISLAVSLAACLSLPLFAQQSPSLTGLSDNDAVVNSIYSITEDNLEVMSILDELSNGIGPRLTSSQNLTEACEWAQAKFDSFGLSNSRLEEWGTFPVGFDRRLSVGALTSPRKMELSFNTNSWTPGTAGKVSGPAFVAPKNAEELAALSGKLSNAWIMCSTTKYSPRFNNPDGDSLRDKFGAMCLAEGFAGVIKPSGKSGLLLTRGRYKIDPDSLPDKINIVLLRDQFAEIHQMAKDGDEVELEFDIEQTFTAGPIPLYNVLAEIPGTDLADEIIIVGGHIDSWDGARGAQDNGTGTSTTLEAARVLKKTIDELGVMPRRTIRFMLWSGEEQGLLGSRAYIKQHPEENEIISAVLVHDGGTNTCSGIQATTDLKPLFDEVFAPIIGHTAELEDEDLRFKIIDVKRLPRGVGSDHDSYLSAGVPGFFWEQSGDANYTYIHHTQYDTIDEVVPAYQFASVRVIASSAWRMANMNQALPREILNQSQENNRPQRHAIGVYLNNEMAVDDLVENGLAVKAGIKVGDIIVSVAGNEIKSLIDLRKALADNKDTREIIWTRQGTKMSAVFDWKNNKILTK